MVVRMALMALALAVPLVAEAARIPLVDSSGAARGSAVVSLSRGTVKMKITGLPPAPATALGATFTAYLYKAYLTSSADPAVEIFVGDVYPTARQTAKVRMALKGDVSLLGLDRVVVTAYSKDARDSVDVLTATLQ